MLEDYAEKNGFTGIRDFTDDGISGTTFEREGLQAMLAEAEKGNIGKQIVDSTLKKLNILSEKSYPELTATTKRRKITERDNSIRERLARAKERGIWSYETFPI